MNILGKGGESESLFFRAKEYVFESRRFIFIVLLIFLVFVVLGFIFGSAFSNILDPQLKKIIDETKYLEGFSLIAFIFMNNGKVALMGLFFGVVLGIFSVLSMSANGFVIGYVLKRVFDMSGITEFWRLFPHGIFELPAIFISFGLGLKLGMFIFNERKADTLKDRLFLSLLAYIFVILPLLALAAIIEGSLISFMK